MELKDFVELLSTYDPKTWVSFTYEDSEGIHYISPSVIITHCKDLESYSKETGIEFAGGTEDTPSIIIETYPIDEF